MNGKNIAAFAALVFVLYAAYSSQQQIDKPRENNTKEFPVEEGVKIMVESVNKTLPSKINDEMVFTKATANGKEAIYDVTINSVLADEVDGNTVKEQLKPQFSSGICSDAKLSAGIKYGVQVTYRFSDLNNQEITRFTINQCF